MTAYGQPTLRIPDRPDTGWMTKAACTPHPAWTAEHKPTRTLAHLQAVCRTCPVIADCAAFALDQNCYGAVYAGVWLPTRHGSDWLNAREELHQKTRTIQGKP